MYWQQRPAGQFSGCEVMEAIASSMNMHAANAV